MLRRAAAVLAEDTSPAAARRAMRPNSDGCRWNGPIGIQRCAPICVCPFTSTKMSSTISAAVDEQRVLGEHAVVDGQADAAAPAGRDRARRTGYGPAGRHGRAVRRHRDVGRAVDHRDRRSRHSRTMAPQQQPVDVEIQAALEHALLPAAHRRAAAAGVRILVVEAHLLVRRRRRQRRAVLLGEVDVARMWCASGAAFGPWMPCSRKTTPAISGLSRGAKKTNQPWSRRSTFLIRAAAMRPVFEMTCAVPVLPQTSCPSIRARPPVPAPLTTHPHPVADRLELLRRDVDLRLRRRRRHRLQPGAVVNRLDQVRRDARAAVGERRRVDRHRDRRHRDLPLADGDRDRLAGVPLLFLLRLPSTRWTAPGRRARSADRCST